MKRSFSPGMHLTGDIKCAAMYARVSTEDQGKDFSIPTQIEACQELAARAGYTVPQAIEVALKGDLDCIQRILIANTKELHDFRTLKSLLRDAFLKHPSGCSVDIPEFEIEKTIYIDEAFDRMAQLYPGLSQAWRKRLTSSREGRQDWLHSLRNNIVHYGSNRDASGRYAEAIVETAFPFLEEMFQRITGNTVSLPHLLMEWIYREVEVARLVRRDLQNEQKPPEPYAIKILQHYVLWTYAAWPLLVMISTRSWSAGRQTGSSILSDGKEHLLRLGKTGSW